MYNWSTDISKINKNTKKYQIWKIEQLINFGLGKEKLSKVFLKKNINNLNIDSYKKNYLNLLLHDKKPSHPQSNKISWIF